MYKYLWYNPEQHVWTVGWLTFACYAFSRDLSTAKELEDLKKTSNWSHYPD